MIKYYRCLKETPLWEQGAIISDEKGDGYRAISDVFMKDVDGLSESWYEGRAAIENQPDWFERVWPLNKFEEFVFGSKVKARAAAAAMYKDKK